VTAERWEQIKGIFQDAAECDPAARAEFLRQRCGNDEELRKEVESLLDSEKDSRSVLETNVMGAGMLAAAPPVQVLAMPAIVADRYEVERELGRGGMSVVYLARDRQLLSKRVVVKVLLAETSQDPWVRQKFLQEMEALARIDHPGVVGVLDSGLTAEGQRFLVMQYIDGVTLRSAIQPAGMSLVRAAGLIRQIGHALSAAHEKGVWHRDLKPENVMLQCLGGEEHVKLIDFGIAAIQDSQFSGEKTKVAGSFTYMAPEQFAGKPCASTDTYALAVIACELLTGKEPFAPGSLSHLVEDEKTGATSLRALRPELTTAAERSILRALSFRPEARHATVREFSEELYQALTGGESTRKASISGTLEIAHVLFTDLVGYSLLPMDQQKEYLEEFQRIVRASPRFRAADASGDIISLPTGDGMALAFFGDPTAPAQCALEVAASLKSSPHLKLRMGVHSGPVYRVADVNANANVAGGGINMAQRVMDCGDAGHILLSRNVAEVLDQLRDWRNCLRDLGVHEVKHGVKVHLFNLCKDGLGNPTLPRKVRATGSSPAVGAGSKPARSRFRLGAAVGIAVLLAGGGLVWRQKAGHAVGVTDSVAAPLPERSLRYFVTVQKFREGKPYQDPFRLAGERVFEADYRIRLTVSSPESGYLYVLNEGPQSTVEKPDLNALFPKPSVREGSARLDPDQKIDTSWIRFDQEKGTERLWLVWSSAAIPELEAVKKWVTPQYMGAVGDPGQARAVLELVNKYSAGVRAETDEADKSTILKGRGSVFARMIPLEHD
jgi:serine/threonine protein kinase